MEYKDKLDVDQEFQNIIYPLVENWKQYSEEEVERLIKENGKICRKEFSIYLNSAAQFLVRTPSV